MKQLLSLSVFVVFISGCSTIDKIEHIESITNKTISPNIEAIKEIITKEVAPTVSNTSNQVDKLDTTLHDELIPKQDKHVKETQEINKLAKKIQKSSNNAFYQSRSNSRRIDRLASSQIQSTDSIFNAMISIQYKIDQQNAMSIENQRIQSNALIALLKTMADQKNTVNEIRSKQDLLADTVAKDLVESRNKIIAIYDSRITDLSSKKQKLEYKVNKEKRSKNSNAKIIELLLNEMEGINDQLKEMNKEKDTTNKSYITLINVAESNNVDINVSNSE